MNSVASPLAQRIACTPALLSSPLAWIGLHALALWPHGVWAWQRARDGSDDPLGVIALAVLGWWVWRQRMAMRVAPRLPWLGAGLALAAASTLALPSLPSLVAASIAALSIACAIVAWLPGGTPRLPLAGLALLSLPVVASMQFYVGYPLRVITAEISTWVLQLAGVDAVRSGASMTVRGQLVIVDAPCSGVQMAWMAYFAACAVAASMNLRDGVFVQRLPWVGAIVLAGNALRNSVLVALEARPEGLGSGAHEAIGLAALAVTTLVVVRVCSAAVVASPSLAVLRQPSPLPSAARGRWNWPRIAAAALTACALLPLAHRQADAAPASTAIEWPTQWDGAALRPLALSDVEHRFAQRFPGQIARFTDDAARIFVMRHVTQPTRMLHPATDCFRATGYRIEHARLERDGQQRLWRCFEARRGDKAGLGHAQQLRVCERIESAAGESHTDASSWFWSATLGSSSGPWRAITVVEAL